VYALQSATGGFGQEVAVLERPEAQPGSDPEVILADLAGDARAEELVALVGPSNFSRAIASVRPLETSALPAPERRWSFLPTFDDVAGRRLSFFATGDVTGDGRIDAVLIASSLGSRVLVARNDGSGPALEVSADLPGGALATGPDLSDVNGDGVLDIIAATGSGIGYLGARGGDLTMWTALTGLGLSDVQELAIGDFNADAVPDVALVRGDDAPRFSALVSSPTGYRERALPVPPGRPCDIDAGELNGDGKADLVLLGCDATGEEVPLDRRVITLLGDGAGGFGQPDVVPPSGRSPNGPTGVAIVDLDGNGLGEVVLTESDSATVIYMNRTVVAPAPRPLPPPPPPPPGCRPREDCTAPRATVTVVGKRWRLRERLVVRVRCDEPCTATVSVQLLFSRRGRVLRSIPVRERPRLALRPSRIATVTFLLRAARRRTAVALLRRGLQPAPASRCASSTPTATAGR
jgi:hypothetical protein